MPKVTFSLDDATVRLLRRTVERARKPRSVGVRGAIAQYAGQQDRLSDAERERLLNALRTIQAQPPTRRDEVVDHESREIRRSRAAGWSRRTRRFTSTRRPHPRADTVRCERCPTSNARSPRVT